jgi:hypothetical protein
MYAIDLKIVGRYLSGLGALAREAGENGHQIVPRQTAIGTTTVIITANAVDQNNNVLTPLTFAYDIIGNPPPPAPPATLTFGTPQVGTFPLPPDPGTATVILI